MSCPEVSSAFATLAISPVPTERPCSHSLAFSSTASASPIHASRTHSWLTGAAHVAEPICKSGPTLPLNNWPSDADCPTLHDFSATPIAKKRALPRLRRPAPKLQKADSNQQILSTSKPRDRSFGECLHALDAPTHGNATLFAAFHRANLALSSIAAPPLPPSSFKSPYRKCLGAYAAASASCPEAFPIKANDFPAK
jgi:hypothetical protein